MDNKEEDIICIEIPKVKRGRPKKLEGFNMKDYMKEYYKKNIEKTKGDIICTTCNVMHSKSNKTRHLKSKLHLEKLKEI